MSSIKIKKQIVEIAKMMYQRRMVNAFEGNLSIREGKRIYITPSAVCKGFLTPEMIMVTDLEGNVQEGACKASSELHLHTTTYQCRKDIHSVIHTHSSYATAFAIANKPIESKAYPEMLMMFDKIPLAEYGRPSTPEVFLGVKKYIMDYNVILLANHGIMAVGNDGYDAFFKIEAAEAVAKVLFLARQLGPEKDLSLEQIMALVPTPSI